MEKNFEVFYNKIEDILSISKKERVKFSIDLALPSGDAVVDIGFDGLVKGIEIFNASKFFSILSRELERIKDAEIRVVYSPSYAALNINLNIQKESVKSHLIIPYSKKLVLA